ncbi:SgcJ/EcaC family oxidoreductase [Micromonospora sp. NPDC049559]|uniref:SgcJ/EcaC family oxidoreductase n=1 Tax=Micromonospora sp. NPDC049559 TaxID=3155923 RepID=UPI003447C0FF
MDRQSRGPVAANPTGDVGARHDAGWRRTEERAVRAVFDATSRAWRSGDADAFVAWYGEDATVILPGACLKGRDEIRAGMAGAFAGALKGSTREHAVLTVRFLGTDAAVVVTRSATSFPGEVEVPGERWELATWALSRRPGGWLVEAFHACPEAAGGPDRRD